MEGLELIRRRAMMGGKSILPQGYTELEYIENTDKAVLAIPVSLPFSVEIDFAPNLDFSYQYAVAFGQNSRFQAGFKQDGTAYIGNRGSTSVFFGDGVKSKITATVTTTATTTSYYVDGVNTGLSRNSNHASEWCLFAADTVGIYPAKGKMYSFRLWKDGELIFDLKPCINPSSVYGMYDIINNIFYGSITSTPFTGQ